MNFNKPLAFASLPALLTGACLADFSGPYAPENWTFLEGTPHGELTMHTADMLVFEGGKDSVGDTDMLITAAASGTWSFDWMYTTMDTTAGFDAGYYVVNDEAVYLATADIWDPPQTGSVSILVQAGDTIGFRVHTKGGYGVGILTITDFSAPVPAPAASLLFIGFGLRPSRRRQGGSP